MGSVHSNDQPAVLFASDGAFRMVEYSNSRLLLRTIPATGQRHLDIFFEGVIWLSLPVLVGPVQISLAHADTATALPARVRREADEGRLLQLTIWMTEVSGTIVCSAAKAAFTEDTETDFPDYVESNVLWSLR